MLGRTWEPRRLRWLFVAVSVTFVLTSLASPAGAAQETARHSGGGRVEYKKVYRASKGRLWVLGQKAATRPKSVSIKRRYLRDAKDRMRELFRHRPGPGAASAFDTCPTGYEHSTMISDIAQERYHPYRDPSSQYDLVQTYFSSEVLWNDNLIHRVSATSVCGFSYSSWLGSDPYVVNDLNNDNYWYQDGQDVSFSAGVPSGVGIQVSGSGQIASLPTPCGQNSYCESQYSGFSWEGSLGDLSQTTRGRYQWTGVLKTIAADATADL